MNKFKVSKKVIYNRVKLLSLFGISLSSNKQKCVAEPSV